SSCQKTIVGSAASSTHSALTMRRRRASSPNGRFGLVPSWDEARSIGARTEKGLRHRCRILLYYLYVPTFGGPGLDKRGGTQTRRAEAKVPMPPAPCRGCPVTVGKSSPGWRHGSGHSVF